MRACNSSGSSTAKTRLPKIRMLPRTVCSTGTRLSPNEATNAPKTISSNPRANGSASSSRARAVGVPMFFHQAISPSAAKLVEAADTKNSGASQTVSPHIGWFVALSSAPV